MWTKFKIELIQNLNKFEIEQIRNLNNFKVDQIRNLNNFKIEQIRNLINFKIEQIRNLFRFEQNWNWNKIQILNKFENWTNSSFVTCEHTIYDWSWQLLFRWLWCHLSRSFNIKQSTLKFCSNMGTMGSLKAPKAVVIKRRHKLGKVPAHNIAPSELRPHRLEKSQDTTGVWTSRLTASAHTNR
jgi:hypothetical protein